jgi:tRNA (guanine37-N1)-methyltransferase
LLRPDLLERPLTKEEIKLLKEIVEEESVRLKGEE